MDRIQHSTPKYSSPPMPPGPPGKASEKMPHDVALLSFTGDDLTEDGRLGLIIEIKDAAQRKSVQQQLLDASPGTTFKADLPLIDGFAVEMDPGDLGALCRLKHTYGDMKIFVDGKAYLPKPEIEDEVRANADNERPDLATKTMQVERIWDWGYTGKGVSIAIFDSGIDPHPDLKKKIIAWHDTVYHEKKPYDDNIHGTHVAGTAAGNGSMSKGKYRGTAPDASLVGVKVTDANGVASISGIIEGMQWMIYNKDLYHIKVMNMSVGRRPEVSYKDDPLSQALEKVAEAGIVPVTAAGNSGPGPESIFTPAHTPASIAVGALDDMGTMDPSDDHIARFSSVGPTKFDGVPKPDVSAPGIEIIAPKAGTKTYIALSGTSMASPFTAGCIALMLCADPTLTVQGVRQLLNETGRRLPGIDPMVQGVNGVINPFEAIKKIHFKKKESHIQPSNAYASN